MRTPQVEPFRARTNLRSPRDVAAALVDGVGHSLVCGMELLPPRPRVATFMSGEVGGEIFDVDLGLRRRRLR